MSTKTMPARAAHRRRRSHDARTAAIIVNGGGAAQYQPALKMQQQRVWSEDRQASTSRIQQQPSRIVQQRRRSVSRRSVVGGDGPATVKRSPVVGPGTYSSSPTRATTTGRVPVMMNTNRVWSAVPGHAREGAGTGAAPAGLDATRRWVAPIASASSSSSSSYAARVVAQTASSSVRPSVNQRSSSPPAIVGASQPQQPQQLLPTVSSTYSTQARDNQRSPSSSSSSTNMPVMSYAAAVGGRRPPVSRSSSSATLPPLKESPAKPTTTTTTPTPTPTTEYIVDDTLPDLASIPGAPEVVTLTTPRPVGRARSNSFYGRAQHTVLCRRRSPPPPPPVSPQSPNSLSAHTLTERSGGLRACAVNLDLDLDTESSPRFVRPRSSSRAAATLVEGLRPSSSSASTTSSCFISCTSSPRSTLDTLRGMSASASDPLPYITTSPRTRSPSPPRSTNATPARPAPTERDARARQVAGMLLNRPKRNVGPTAAAGARARRRALWACVERGENGVFAGSCLRREVVAVEA